MSKTITIRLNNEKELMMDKLAKMYDCGISTASNSVKTYLS